LNAKILAWDTEWSPATTYTWDLYPERIGTNMVQVEPRMLCWGARWLDQPDTLVVDERMGRKKMLVEIRDLLSEADMVLSYNGQAFDTRKLNGELFREDIAPPAPYKEIDLFRVVKKNFKYLSHKLDWVAEVAGVGRKLDTGGFGLWQAVLQNDEAAWDKMRNYQAQDVDLLIDLFERMKPWVKMPHPIEHGDDKCRNCGGVSLQRRGLARTLNGSYQRFQCQDCFTWSRGTKRTSDTNVRSVS